MDNAALIDQTIRYIATFSAWNNEVGTWQQGIRAAERAGYASVQAKGVVFLTPKGRDRLQELVR